MAFALIASAKSSSPGTDSSSTDAIDTSGANLIVVAVAWHGTTGITLTDNKSNTWTALTARQAGDLTANSRLYYCFNPTVGSGHTFTSSGTGTYANVFVQAWSGSASSPFDQQNGATSAAASSLATGSVTPSENNELLVATVSVVGSSFSINSSFTISGQADNGPNRGGGMAYKVQTSAVAENPTWSWTSGGSFEPTAAIATFKGPGGGGGGSHVLAMMAQNEG